MIKMHLWTYVFITLPYAYCQLRETEYECGRHGRFEYCIDGIPGCVIGCHCHPGYYFDTDTKICEPNIRLTQNFRRNFDVIEPTRVYLPPTPPVVEAPVTTASKNAVDEKIDIITNDADDLGDWLYNQFFKTIENQVINETKDESIITRRSDNPPSFVKNPTRRSHKRLRSRRKKKKKKKGLKSKLLRITEDDSMFDSSGSSTSVESSDSSASSDSSGSGSTLETYNERKHRDKTKSDHGHKKIIVYNKRPKPPLPSFIFLPNMETPFLPPIALPPPVMPMYPMVPVPPMMQFPFSGFTSPTPPSENGNKGAGLATDAVPVTINVLKHNKTENDGTTANGVTTATPITPVENDVESVDDNREEKTIQKDEEDDVKEFKKPSKLLRNRSKKRQGSRNKLVQKLHDKLKRKNKLQNFFAQAYQENSGGPLMDSNNYFEPGHHTNRHKFTNIDEEDELASLQDVDFKYISQLIHRVDLNKTNQIPTPIPLMTPPTIPIINGHNVPPPARNPKNQNTNPDDTLNDLIVEANPQTHPNLGNHPIYISPNNPTFDAHNPLPSNAPNQLPYSVHNKVPYHSVNQLPYQTLNQPYNPPIQSTYNALNQPSYNSLNQLTYNTPIRPVYNTSIPSTHNASNQPTHVSLNQHLRNAPHRKKIEETNDSYYANLGRQIASMIRNLDTNKEVNIEIKASNIPINPLLTGNGGSRSYWERSVRSPNYTINLLKKEMNNLKKNNEDLFNLENKVEMAAFKDIALSLPELENIISKMQRTKSKFITKNKTPPSTSSSKTSFNVNLLPENSNFLSSDEIDALENKEVTMKVIKRLPKRTIPKLLNLTTNNLMATRNLATRKRDVRPPPLSTKPRLSSSLLRDFLFSLQDSYELVNDTIPKTYTIADTYITRKAGNVAPAPLIYKVQNPRFNSYTYTVLPLPQNPPFVRNLQLHLPYLQATTSRTYNTQLNPFVLNQKSIDYYDVRNNNKLLYTKTYIPVKPRSYTRHVASAAPYAYETRVKPSYFHHKVHHFDYFDDII